MQCNTLLTLCEGAKLRLGPPLVATQYIYKLGTRLNIINQIYLLKYQNSILLYLKSCSIVITMMEYFGLIKNLCTKTWVAHRKVETPVVSQLFSEWNGMIKYTDFWSSWKVLLYGYHLYNITTNIYNIFA